MPSAGDQWLQFRLVEKIGEGGMGVVWKAVDTRLDREVALKLLPGSVAGNDERRVRFEREARLLAALSHPNIAGIHGLHAEDGRHFLSMELAAGEDLAERLCRGPLPVDETIAVARQLAAALSAAHDRNIVHRDLKPANVKLSMDGSVKVLDFGLAKAMAGDDEAPAPSDMERSPTVTSTGTAAGVILGTAAYMSPEQARGRPVDRRSDLWSFGCVVYELLTGTCPFEGETVSDTLAAILRSEPDWSRLPVGTPPELERLLRRCLVKDPASRWRDAGDAWILLGEGVDEERPTRAPDAGKRVSGLAVTLALLAGLLGGTLLGSRLVPRTDSTRPVVDAHVPVPAGYRTVNVKISPDGRWLAIVLTSRDPAEAVRGYRLALRRVDGTRLDWIDVGLAEQGVQFSPDSREIVFVARSHPGVVEWALVRAPLDGSPNVTLIAPWQDSWSDTVGFAGSGDVAVVDTARSELLLFPLDGRPQPRPVSIRSDRGGAFLLNHWLPGGDLLGTFQTWDGGYRQHVARVDPGTGESSLLAEVGFEPMWSPPGHVVFSRGDQLVALPYDPSLGRSTGSERTVASGLRASVELTAATFGLSTDGDLVHRTGGTVGRNRSLVWVDPDGTRSPWGNVRGAFVGDADDSQDGSWVAFSILSADGLFEIWASPTDRLALAPALAVDGMDCSTPVVSPRARWIAGRCAGDVVRAGVYVAPLDADEGPARRILASTDNTWIGPASWLPNGRELLVLHVEEGRRSILRVGLDSTGSSATQPTRLEGLDPRISYASVSPDERHVALVAFERDRRSVSLAAWRDGRIGALLPIGPSDSREVDWVRSLPDGREELLILRDGSPHRIFVDPDGNVSPPRPIEGLVEAIGSSLGVVYLSDGRALIVEPDPEELDGGDIRLVSGWTSTWQ